VEIPKPDGGVQKLGIPAMLDRFIQQAVARAQQYIARAHGCCVDLDLETFVDRVSHDKLTGQIANRVADKRLLKLIRVFLERRGHHFVRYADDCNIYVRGKLAGQRVMESVTQFITQELKLKANEAKSAVA